MFHIFIIIIIIIILFLLIQQNNKYDYFSDTKGMSVRITPMHTNDNLNSVSTHTNFPFWNTQIGIKRNMSYDLRGDIDVDSFYNIEMKPIKNKPLYMIS